jgi:N-glycosylase/DNA lyase
MAGFDPRDSTSVDLPVPTTMRIARAAAQGLEDRPAEGILRRGWSHGNAPS